MAVFSQFQRVFVRWPNSVCEARGFTRAARGLSVDGIVIWSCEWIILGEACRMRVHTGDLVVVGHAPDEIIDDGFHSTGATAIQLEFSEVPYNHNHVAELYVARL
jgi:hypothetical protein